MNQSEVNLAAFWSALQSAWNYKTHVAIVPWSDGGVASTGQGSATSLVTQDYFGGGIMRCDVPLGEGAKAGHFYNTTEFGEMDFTWSQFSERGFSKRENVRLASREEVLSSPTILSAYHILSHAVDHHLRGQLKTLQLFIAGPKTTQELNQLSLEI